jgi:hypothetical protein
VHTGGSGHVDQRIQAKQVDFSTLQIRDARLRNAKQFGGFRLTPFQERYDLLDFLLLISPEKCFQLSSPSPKFGCSI